MGRVISTSSMMRKVKIAPSILAANFARLGDELHAMTEAGADYIHIDVMDGHFVPNLTIGANVVKALRASSPLPFDVHLMISPVDPFVEGFVKAGADIITVHPEAGPHLDRTLQLIRGSTSKRGAPVKAGVALNPATPIALIEEVLEYVDLVLVMSVNPGFGGQEFISSQLKKIEALRKAIDRAGLKAELEVDGGINDETAPRVVAAGADVLVAGTASFKGGPDSYAANIRRLKGGA